MTAARAFWLPTILGVVWLVFAVQLAPSFLVYLLPVVVGWILSIPLAVLTSEPSVGERLTRSGLFDDCLSASETEELGELLE